MAAGSGTATAFGVKAHALYSQFLTEDDYWEMLGLKSTADIATFLKQTAGYKDHLQLLPAEQVHRIDLENAVRSSILAEANSFLFYLIGARRKFFLDWLSGYEAEQLKSVFRWLRSRRLSRDEMERQLFHIPGSGLQYENLLNSRDYKDAAAAIRDTKYYKAVREPIRRLSGGETSLFSFEVAIDHMVEADIFNDIKDLPAKDQNLLTPLFGARIDLLNVYHFHRCSWYYNMTTEETVSRMLPVKYKVKTSHLRELAQTADRMSALALLEEMFPVYGKIFREAIERDDLELSLEMSIRRFIYSKALSVFRNGSPGFHTAAAYFILKDVEVTDIIRMIEYVRYGYDKRTAAEYVVRPIITGGETAWQ